jgi:hypothetical protein
MISAKEPFGGGFEGTAAGFRGAAFAGAGFAGAGFTGVGLVAALGPVLETGPGDTGLRLVAGEDLGKVLSTPGGAGTLLLDEVAVFEA